MEKGIKSYFFELWLLTDHDLLTNWYRLRNTGQGLQRIQSCPKVSHKMHQILNQLKASLNQSWQGLSVIHLADNDVPNALVFIDKYNTIPKMIIPFVSVIKQIKRLSVQFDKQQDLSQDVQQEEITLQASKQPKRLIYNYIIQLYGSTEQCIQVILRDIFRLGFNSSGPSGGSCIDGKSTSFDHFKTTVLPKKVLYHF